MWQCEHCSHENGPEAVYCTECGEAGPDEHAAAADEAAHTEAGSRNTLVGSSTGIAPSLADRGAHAILVQPIPRQVHLGLAGWSALIGGWPEMCLCLVSLPLVALGAYAAGLMLGGIWSALIAIGGFSLFIVLAFLYGAGDTLHTLRGYKLVRHGWATAGEITHKSSRKHRLGPTFELTYGFLDGRNVHRSGKLEVQREQWRQFAIHEPVTVLFMPDRPELSTVYELLPFAQITPGPSEATSEDGGESGTPAGG